jgi:L-ascorbate metabolism protein UlaG (beta-lactamase superfamily)
MDSHDAVKSARTIDPQTLIPIHYEGRKHFSEGRTAIEGAFAAAKLTAELRWLSLGLPTTINM